MAELHSQPPLQLSAALAASLLANSVRKKLTPFLSFSFSIYPVAVIPPQVG